MVCCRGVEFPEVEEGARMAGPQSFSVAARLRFTSVTVALRDVSDCNARHME